MKERLERWWKIAEWQLEAWRTGDDFEAIAQRRSLVYRVEQLFLIERWTSRLLLHVTADPAVSEDSARLEKTVTHIQRLARDYFIVGNESDVEQFQLRDAEVWLAPGARSHLAAVIRGNPPPELRTVLQDAIRRINLEDASAPANFHDDSAALEPAGLELTACLRSEYKPIPVRPRLRRVWVRGAAAVLVMLVIALLDLRSELRWRDFLARLKLEPGILVATAERNRFAPSRVLGARDPLARDPTAIATEAKLNPARIRFEWSDYSADDPAIAQRRLHQDFTQHPGVPSMLRRVPSRTADPTGPTDATDALEQFKTSFKPPSGVEAAVVNNTLVLAGAAPYEWVAAVQEGATRIGGITAIKGDDLVVEFDQDLVLQRVRDQFGIPDTVSATVRRGHLILSGEAPHAWFDRVRRDALRVPGVRVIDHRNLENIDQRAFQQAKLALEDAAILFVLNRDGLPPGAEVELGRLAAEAQRCLVAAENMGMNINLEVRAYGDAIATEAENAELSRRRAETVRKFLEASGVDMRKITATGLGAPPFPESGEKSGAGKFDRRVFLRVVIQP